MPSVNLSLQPVTLSWKWAIEVAILLVWSTDNPLSSGSPAAWGWIEAGGAGDTRAGKGEADFLRDTWCA